MWIWCQENPHGTINCHAQSYEQAKWSQLFDYIRLVRPIIVLELKINTLPRYSHVYVAMLIIQHFSQDIIVKDQGEKPSASKFRIHLSMYYVHCLPFDFHLRFKVEFWLQFDRLNCSRCSIRVKERQTNPCHRIPKLRNHEIFRKIASEVRQI